MFIIVPSIFLGPRMSWCSVIMISWPCRLQTSDTGCGERDHWGWQDSLLSMSSSPYSASWPPPTWWWSRLANVGPAQTAPPTVHTAGESIIQSEASIQVTWPLSSNQRPVFTQLTNHSDWGWCQWTDQYGDQGPRARLETAEAGACSTDKDCSPRFPVCSNLGYCTVKDYFEVSSSHSSSFILAWRSWRPGFKDSIKDGRAFL